MEAEDGAERSGERERTGAVAGDAGPDRPSGLADALGFTGADDPAGEGRYPPEGGDPGGDGADGPPAEDAQAGRRGVPVTTGIGCAALLLPVLAVLGAILCFAAGILSAANGCSSNGSALCSSNGPWIAFALPLFVAPFIAAVAAIGAVLVRRHRSTWLAVGYGVVFISLIVGLAVASTGSN